MKGGGRAKAGTSRKADSKLAVNKKAAKGEKKVKGSKDPNKPKRPPSAFFVFMEGFRKEYKEKNPKNKLVSVVAKAGGDKWKSMTEAEKAPYEAKAKKLKAEYQRKLDGYADKKSGGGNDEEEEEESSKSKSEVNDEDEEGSEGDGEEVDEDDE